MHKTRESCDCATFIHAQDCFFYSSVFDTVITVVLFLSRVSFVLLISLCVLVIGTVLCEEVPDWTNHALTDAG